jgi:tryptophan-rich sensory protein
MKSVVKNQKFLEFLYFVNLILGFLGIIIFLKQENYLLAFICFVGCLVFGYWFYEFEKEEKK